ncbi:peptidase C14, caspase domain-containing protein [Armillaria nabsnona]|nr:peptidase C14, caspase domain-containing protein [Armillaria nabsnona]
MSRFRRPIYYDRHRAAHRVDGNHFWAVLIGIDGYSSSPLRGCVADVEKMKEFLTADLGVPEDHIQRLVSTQTSPKPISTTSHLAGKFKSYIGRLSNETSPSQEQHADHAANSPTRANIIETLLNLSVNDRIQDGDNIIIYFSGHGSSYRCSDYYKKGSVESKGRIEALCPVDRAPGNSFRDSVPDISDREFNTILTEISRTKGHHITCILDCCYSSSITRDPNDQTCTRGVRRTKPLPPVSITDMFNAAHRRLKGLKSYRHIRDGDWSPDMTSHVVLAACQETEHAQEDEGENGYNGIFTRALIEALKSDSLSAGSTYQDLIDKVDIDPRRLMVQKPIAAGSTNERLWYQDCSDKKYVVTALEESLHLDAIFND